MDIPKYIKELIIRNECIILPGFGGFETDYKPAYVDKNTGSFIPPSKQIIFRQDFTKDNGVLVSYVSTKEKIPAEAAEQAIGEFIKKLSVSLAGGQQFVIDGIGTFNYTDDQKLIFFPFESENYLIDSFGLSAFKQKKLYIEKKEQAGTERIIEKKKSYKTGTVLIIGIVVTLLTIFVLLMLGTDLFNGSGKTRNPSASASDDNDKTVFGQMKLPKKDSTQIAIDEQLSDNTSKQTALQYRERSQAAIKPVEVYNNRSSGLEEHYQIVAGSFLLEHLAMRQAEELRKKGYHPVVIKTGNDFYRVVLDTFDNKTRALNELRTYRSELGSTVWIASNNG